MTIKVTVVGSEDVRRKLHAIGQRLSAQALAATAEDVESYVQAEAGKHSNTGALFRSVVKHRDGNGWMVEHDLQVAKHALFLHWGTGLYGVKGKKYKIAPKPGSGKKSLRFAKGGFTWPVNPNMKGKAGRSGFAFAKFVMHPGIKGDPWLVRAAALAPAMFTKHVEAQLARITKD